MKLLACFSLVIFFSLTIVEISWILLQAHEQTVEQRRGQGKVQVVQYKNGSWELLLDGAPYFIKGIEYGVDPIGTVPPLVNQWLQQDRNNDGRPDDAYESWVDANGNGQRDPEEPTAGDFQLLQDMGCNTIRIYHPDNLNEHKHILRDLTKTYGIRVIMGNFLGAYAIGSGASATEGTDYTDTRQKEKMMQSVQTMVHEHKDEPYLLLWMLGNENDAEGSRTNSTFNNTNAAEEPEAYATFVNDVAKWIHEHDPHHPVGVCNATHKLLNHYKKFSPEIDIIGMNAYSGSYGFGTLWSRMAKTVDRPVLITEYGTDAYDQIKETENEEAQAQYHRGAWRDILRNSHVGKKGRGNALGGVVYQWCDKWWFSGSPNVHDTALGAWAGPAPDGYFNDEWLGITHQGAMKSPPGLRHLRKAYYAYQEMWVHNKINHVPHNRRGRPVE